MSMQSVASPAAAFGPPKRAALAHIPGDEGWPVIGRTLAILADPKGEVERMAAKYGLVYRSRVLGDAMAMPVGSMVEKFRGELEEEIERARDRAGAGELDQVIPLGVADGAVPVSPAPTGTLSQKPVWSQPTGTFSFTV